MVGRTDNSIKNHWNSSMQRKLRPLEDKLNRMLRNLSTPKSNSIEYSSETEKKLIQELHKRREAGEMDTKTASPGPHSTLTKRPPLVERDRSAGRFCDSNHGAFWDTHTQQKHLISPISGRSPFGLYRHMQHNHHDKSIKALHSLHAPYDKENDSRMANMMMSCMHDSPSK